MVNELEIEAVTGREMLDSRGNPTVEVEMCLTGGATGRAVASSDASTGRFETVELRDGGNRYNGLGVQGAVEHVNTAFSEAVLLKSALDQRHIDRLFLRVDGTRNKGKLGVNVILGVSTAAARAAANELRMPLYRHLGGIHAFVLSVSMMNIPNGGEHMDNTADLQEFMIMPSGACCFAERLRMCVGVYHTLKKLLREEGYSTGAGDESGFAPGLKDSEAISEFLAKAMEKSELKPGTDMKVVIDAVSSELYDKASGMYLFPGESRMAGKETWRSVQEMVDYYCCLIDAFPICSIEDGLQEEDWEGWKMLTKELGGRIQLVGDDLFVTNMKRLLEGTELGAGNAILVKVSQTDTLSESFEAIEVTKRVGFGAIISHRSGEAEGSIIADTAVAVNVGQIKTGTPCRSDRVAKHNQLPRIEENLEGQKVTGERICVVCVLHRGLQ